ncbi:MAG: hypothetical protein A3K83_01350 [Omnitrophica WOR_2 bacterium RBG_13_44_8b]|nr:MAG: hypothetical protein A3K83_01350 [Omnitrophica WOR_2 bacterium RBG_13_44_8b]
MVPLRILRKRIGDLLLERRIITQQQLARALEEQKNKGGYVSQHLIALGFATELDIATCLSNQYNFAYLPLKNYVISQDVLDTIPLKWIRIYTLLPVDKIGNTLSVVMADPLNEGVIEMLQQITGCEVMVFISTYSELDEAITRYFKHKLKDLEKHIIEPKDLEKIRTVNQFVQTKAYAGAERREYVRVKKELDVFFYYHDSTFQGRTNDISYGGVSFVSEDKGCGGLSFSSNIFMPLNTSLACKIHLTPGPATIDVVINVLRVQGIKTEAEVDSQGPSGQKYEIGGMFEFISNEDREALLSFLKKEIP